MSLKKGDKAPYFKLNNQDGKSISLDDLKGKKTVLYFYPKDNTPTCTTEACNLRDNHNLLKKQGYVIYGISPDSEKKHQNFIKKFSLPFDLLADTDHQTADAFGVWGEKTLFGVKYMGVLRTTFLIDENGVISEVIDKVESKNHAEQILGQKA